MKYREVPSEEENNLQKLPFDYDISEAGIINKYANIVMSPLRIEPRIDGIKLSRNTLKQNGFMELAKILLVNKSIKNIDFHTCLLKSSYIDFLNNYLGLFDNNFVEILNLSFNYLKEDCVEYLANILTHFKKVKTINLSSNDFKNGISSFLINLKKLYRQGKCDLESLNLNKCILDDISYYELGDLLKSKYCKLKKLYLSDNNIPSNINFLKNLKKNRYLTEIYFNKSTIGNNDTDDIMRIISNSNIEYLYLNNNKINNFSQCLRIIYRTILIKKKEKIIKKDSNLYNLDLGHNFCFNKNSDKTKLLLNSLDKITLYCLDFSRILYNNSPNSFEKTNLNKLYTDSVDELISKLKEEEEKYKNTIGQIKSNNIAQKKLQKKNYDEFKNLDEEIIKIIKDEKAIYPAFLKDEAKKLISKSDKIINELKKIIINNNKKEIKKKFCEIQNKLVDYMNLIRINIKNDELNQIKNSKKMIII